MTLQYLIKQQYCGNTGLLTGKYLLASSRNNFGNQTNQLLLRCFLQHNPDVRYCKNGIRYLFHASTVNVENGHCQYPENVGDANLVRFSLE